MNTCDHERKAGRAALKQISFPPSPQPHPMTVNPFPTHFLYFPSWRERGESHNAAISHGPGRSEPGNTCGVSRSSVVMSGGILLSSLVFEVTARVDMGRAWTGGAEVGVLVSVMEARFHAWWIPYSKDLDGALRILYGQAWRCRWKFYDSNIDRCEEPIASLES